MKTRILQTWVELVAAGLTVCALAVGAGRGQDITPGGLSVALLSPDRADVPAGRTNPIGVWAFNPEALKFDSASLTFCYDAAKAGSLRLDPNSLKLYGYNGSGWVLIPTNPCDTVNDLLTTTAGLPSFCDDYAICGAMFPNRRP
jgi:hypothetical protein